MNVESLYNYQTHRGTRTNGRGEKGWHNAIRFYYEYPVSRLKSQHADITVRQRKIEERKTRGGTNGERTYTSKEIEGR